MERGFSLLELLLSVSVVGVLSAIAFAATQGVRMGSLQTKSISNMRQLGIAANHYCNEHDGNFPESAHVEEERSWVYSLQSYLQNVDEVRICPADPKAAQRRKLNLTSYVLNEFIVVPKRSAFGRTVENFRNRGFIPRPAETLLAFIGADHMDLSVSSDHTHSRNWRFWELVLNDIQPDRFRTGRRTKHFTNGRSGYLYTDGHVEVRDALWLKDLIDRGINPARPPVADL